MSPRDLLFIALVSCATTLPRSPSPPVSANPFDGAKFYVSPEWKKSAQGTNAASFPTAIWIDSIAKVASVSRWLDDARAEQEKAGAATVTVFVLYDLPNRDCSAKSSAGELDVEQNGEARYRAEVVDPLAAAFRAHPMQRIAVIVEPDSLANIATNGNVPKCAASDGPYRRSIAYAIERLAMTNVALYLDAAHAGWLGWDGNREKIAAVFADVLQKAGGTKKIRGFATNVSGYNVLRGDDGKRLEPSTPCPDELTYVEKLSAALESAGISDAHFVIDTSRNGRAGVRSKWGNWCNIKGAGLGERPRASPAPLIDAYFWVKVPGESDGTSSPSAARFDPTCASADAAPNAPEAGQWFAAYFTELVKNANPPL
jgi:cellulose 1,4-beta-cellobiosidase